LKILSSEDKKLLFAFIILIVLSFLAYSGVIDQQVFVSIISMVVGYYFGSGLKQYGVTRKTYVVRGAVLMAGFGMALVIQKIVCCGAVVTYPPLLDHGLYGVILILLSAIILTKKNSRYWWE